MRGTGADAPITPSLKIRAYSHHLGTCTEAWMARATLAKTLRRGFLKSLNGMPVLLPTDDTAIRRALDQWFAQHDVHPVVIGEFEDYALLREFARAGHGFAPVPVVMEEQFRRQYDFGRIGLADTDLRILRDLFGTQDQTSCAGGDGRERTPDLLQLNAA